MFDQSIISCNGPVHWLCRDASKVCRGIGQGLGFGRKGVGSAPCSP